MEIRGEACTFLSWLFLIAKWLTSSDFCRKEHVVKAVTDQMKSFRAFDSYESFLCVSLFAQWMTKCFFTENKSAWQKSTCGSNCRVMRGQSKTFTLHDFISRVKILIELGKSSIWPSYYNVYIRTLRYWTLYIDICIWYFSKEMKYIYWHQRSSVKILFQKGGTREGAKICYLYSIYF